MGLMHFWLNFCVGFVLGVKQSRWKLDKHKKQNNPVYSEFIVTH